MDDAAAAAAPAPAPRLLGLYEQPWLRKAGPVQPARSVALPTAPYLTHLALLPGAPAVLVAASSDGALRAHDPASLAPLASATWHGGSVSALAASPSGALAAGTDGTVALWDPRVGSAPAVQLKGPANAPYLSVAIAQNGTSVAAGTELKGYEAMIDLWDLRSATKPAYIYTESHSDDVTSLSFHPSSHAHLLLSGSTDGLLSVLDTRVSDEDDAVLGVANTGASVACAGWGGSPTQQGTSTATEMQTDGGDAELEVKEARAEGMGGFWGVSDMQTVSVWNERFDATLPSIDVRTVRSLTWETDYCITASDARALAWEGPGADADGFVFWAGSNSGRAALVQAGSGITESSTPWKMLTILPDASAGGHADVVRTVCWDRSSRTLFTGGEDGLLCAWDMTAATAGTADDSASSPLPAGIFSGSLDSSPAAGGASRKASKQHSRHTPY